jgi:hypothetical protein
MTDHRTVGRRDISFIACWVRWTLRCRNRSRPSCAHMQVCAAGSRGASVRALAGPPSWRRVPACESVLQSQGITHYVSRKLEEVLVVGHELPDYFQAASHL